jgi:tRNA-dihydrouridine synthase
LAAELGVPLLTLHARTTQQFYGGTARHEETRKLRDLLNANGFESVKLLANGDVFTAADARRIVAETGADGVAVGRGSIGRPWIFQEIACFEAYKPSLFEVIDVLKRHISLLIEDFRDAKIQKPELRAIKLVRGAVAPYFKGYPVGAQFRAELLRVTDLEVYNQMLEDLKSRVGDAPYPGEVAEMPRGRTKSSNKVKLPDGWREDWDFRNQN